MIENGDDWFTAASDRLFPRADGVTRPERRTLVKYHRVDGTTCSASETTPTELRPYRIENGKPVFHKSFWTTYSKTKVSGDGNPFTTVQVVHPFLKDADAAKAAASIQFTEVGDGTAKLRLPTDGHGIVEVTIHGDGATATWKAN